MKEKFNPNNWLNSADRIFPVRTDLTNGDISSDTELIISRIEQAHTDLTAAYSDWVNIGFALASEFGESGRDYYHRVSRFYPGYSITECDKQYDHCLKARGHGITIKTLFHLAKAAGVDIICPVKEGQVKPVVPASISSIASNLSASIGPDSVKESTNLLFNTPQLPAEVYDHLPLILQESADLFQDSIEKDVFLMGAIAVLSGCLPNVEGIYFDEPNSAHLYTFITAPAGSGKGKMKWAKFFGLAIHQHLVDQSRKERSAFESELDDYNNLTRAQRRGAEKPQEPPRKMFYIPANSSSSAFIQALSDNNFRGMLFETEADTLADTFKQEWGNFSDVLRKAFHHESTSMFRRKDQEFIEIRDPHMAIALSGTPKQVHNMIPDVENGLFSRFMYYAFEDNCDFKNPFISHRPVDYTDFFKQKATVIFDLYQLLENLPQKITFQLTDEQACLFTTRFNTMLSRNKLLLGRDFDANIKRLGLITFRMAMIFSALRILETGELGELTEQATESRQPSNYRMICTDSDFECALTIAMTLEKHAISVFQNLPNNDLKGIKLKFYEALPESFDRQGYIKVAESLAINVRTAEKYIAQFKPKLLSHEHNQYTKLE